MSKKICGPSNTPSCGYFLLLHAKQPASITEPIKIKLYFFVFIPLVHILHGRTSQYARADPEL